MKTLKLSLASALAMGAFAALNAAPLEEAIKDIDVSGFGRYRYDANHYKFDENFALGESKSNNNFHRFTLDVNFKATLDDNFFAFIGVRYDSRDISGAGNSDTRAFRGITNNRGGLSGMNATYGNGWGGGGNSFAIRQYYVGFTGLPNTTILAGRQPINSSFTDDSVGTGLKIINNSIEGLTISAYAFDNIEDDEDLSPFDDYRSGTVLDPTYGIALSDIMPGLDSMPYQNNLYGFAIKGAYDWFNFGAEVAHLQNVTTLWLVDLGANYAINDDFSIRARANVAGSHFTGKFKDRMSIYPSLLNYGEDGNVVKNSTLWGLTAGLSAYGFDFDAGYVQFGKKDMITIHSIEDNGVLIKGGELLFFYPRVSGKHKAWFAKAAYTYDAFSVGVDYVHDKVKNDLEADMKNEEWVIRAGYKYSDKLKFNAYYSMITEKTEAKTYDLGYGDFVNTPSYKDKRNRLRIEATYSF